MIDIKTLNANPLNQLCRNLLRQQPDTVKYLDPMYPYSLGLVKWVLEKMPDQMPVREEFLPAIRQNVEGMLGWEDPILTQSFLLNLDRETWDQIRLAKEPEKGILLQDQMQATLGQLKGKTAEEAAANLVDNLYFNLSEILPGLR
jgi:hypothetical protein